jgi:hypothetical protein
MTLSMRIPAPSEDFVAWVTVIGFVATLAGLGLVWYQTAKSRSAAEAARDAARGAEARVRGNLALVLLARLNDIDREIDLSVRDDDRRGAVRATLTWRETAGEVIGLLPELLQHHDDFRKKLQESVALATAAKESLLDDSRAVMDCTKRFRAGVGQVCTQVAVVLAEIKTDAGGTNGAIG